MPSKGADFIHLHQLRRQLKEVQDQLARGPRQIKLRQAKVTEAEASAAAKEQELKESKIALDRKNLELKSKETHLLDLQAKLNTASSNREYDIISGQIAADKAAKSVLEDEILEYLDRVDALQKAEMAMDVADGIGAHGKPFAGGKAGGLHVPRTPCGVFEQR